VNVRPSDATGVSRARGSPSREASRGRPAAIGTARARCAVAAAFFGVRTTGLGFAFTAVFGRGVGGAVRVAVGRGAARCTGAVDAVAVRAGGAGAGVDCAGAAVTGGSGVGTVLVFLVAAVAPLAAGRDGFVAGVAALWVV